MTSRIRIFDHYLRPLVELHGAPTTPRGWILNQAARCEFSVGFDATLKQSAQKWNEKNFQYGNLVHIEHLPTTNWTLTKNGKLPNWTGIILPNRDWDLGVGHVTAYSAEAILQFRAMPFVTVKGTPGTVFKQILELANARARGFFTIQPGQVDDLPQTYPDDLRTNAYDHILKLVGDCGMNWDVQGSVNDKGNLDLTANLYQRKGVDTALQLTSQNTEMQGPLLSEQGTPTNYVFGYSQASSSASRIGPLEGINQEALNDYGPLQLNQVYMGKKDGASVLNAAQNRADKRGRPVRIIKRIALDRASTFSYLDVGNTVTVKETRAGFNPNGGFGFESQAKILSMDYNDMSNKVVLNIEVI